MITDKKLARMYIKGTTIEQLMMLLSVGRPQVWRRLHRGGIPAQKRGPIPNPVLADGTKWCERCKQFVLAENFHKDLVRGTLKSWCKNCNKITQRRGRYGISQENYLALLEKQSSLCAICGLPPDEYRNGNLESLVVDHDHKTGVVRGLLHHRCNLLIGTAKDDSEILHRAAAYLESHQ